MYDPSTVAFEIKYPWYKTVRFTPQAKPWRYRSPFIQIWHVDPETDGTDDSCGWSSPKPSESDRKLIAEIVEWDLKFPYFSSPSVVESGVVVNPEYKYHQLPPGDALALVASAWSQIAWRRDRRSVGPKDWAVIVNLATNPVDNVRSSLVDPDRPTKEKLEGFLYCVLRAYLRFRRPWWRHPRWHVHHWRFQVHPWQQLRRWLFERCSKCGKGYPWGYCPSGNWSGTETWHYDCGRPKVEAVATTQKAHP